jgi:uncharacterized damage-inducible protein DinB
MTTVALMRAMARNNAWSNHRLLEACGGLSEADYKAARTSFFPSIHLTLNHILIVDWYYIDALEAGGLGPKAYENEEPCPTFAALDAAQRASDRALIAYADRLTDEVLDARVDLDRGPRGIKREKASAVLAHLFQHQVHHRGQVHAMLAGTPVAPPQLDEFFLEEDIEHRARDLQTMARAGYPVL